MRRTVIAKIIVASGIAYGDVLLLGEAPCIAGGGILQVALRNADLLSGGVDGEEAAVGFVDIGRGGGDGYLRYAEDVTAKGSVGELTTVVVGVMGLGDTGIDVGRKDMGVDFEGDAAARLYI